MPRLRKSRDSIYCYKRRTVPSTMLPDFNKVHPDVVCHIAPPPHTVLVVAATQSITDTKNTTIKSRPGPTMFSMMRAQRMYRMVKRVQTSTSYAPLVNIDLDHGIHTAQSSPESTHADDLV